MRERLVLVLLVIAALMPAVLAFSVPSGASAAPAAATSQASAATALTQGQSRSVLAQAAPKMHYHGIKTLADGSRRCTIHYAYSNGLTGGLFPKAFSKVEFTTSNCGNAIRTVVRYKPTALTGCTRAPISGWTRKLHKWVQSTGPNKLYCDSWVSFAPQGRPWGPWEKLKNTGNAAMLRFAR